MIRRSVLGLLATPFIMPAGLRAEVTITGESLAAAAEAQEGVVTIYDPAYVTLDFPGGDVAPERGVCTDVLVRALRVAEGIDLQVAVNRDMKADFAAYPKNWGLTRPDRNIDHRRVPNLRRLFERVGAEKGISDDPEAYHAGDVITCLIPGDLAHLMVVGTGQAGWLALGILYASGKYLFSVQSMAGEALDRAILHTDGQDLGESEARRQGPGGRLRRLFRGLGHADLRWHLWIVLATVGRVGVALRLYAVYFPARTGMSCLKRGVEHVVS